MRSFLNILQKQGHRLLLCALVFGFSAPVLAQTDDDEEETVIKKPVRAVQENKYPTVELHGVVYDQATRQPLAGVQVQTLGNTHYTAMSGADGSFTIKVPEFTTALYVFSPEYISQQVAVNATDPQQVITIHMLSDKFRPMYGTGTVITATNGFANTSQDVTIDSEIENQLQGNVRGIQRSGYRDGGAAYFIRGLNSLTSSSQPLIIIDGVEQDMQLFRSSQHEGQFNNILANIMPDDIESVQVLKNATALYGSRGGNGVIIINTKRGHSMATRIDANISAGYELIPQLPTVMNASQYRTYATEMLGTVPELLEHKEAIAFNFLNDDPTGYYYNMYHNDMDWTDYVYRNALTQNYSINVQGGDDIGMYNLSVGYIDAQATAKKNSFNRMNVRFNTDIEISYRLKTRFDISIARTNNEVFDDGVPANLSRGTVTSPNFLALIKSPLVSPYQYNAVVGDFTNLLSSYDDLYGQLGDDYSLANPVAILTNGSGDNKNKAENTYFNVKLVPTYDFGHGFKLTELISYNLNRNSQRYHRPYTGVPPFEIDGLGTVTSKVMSLFSKESNFVTDTRLDWQRQYGRHTLAVFGGFRYNIFSFDSPDLATENDGQTNDKNPSLGGSYQYVGGANDTWKNMQWYGNVDYNYMNRYFATISLTAEANNRFGEEAGLKLFGTSWAFFPSLQLGWVLTNENWFPKNNVVNYLRLNAGYDISGNDNIDNYAARTSFSVRRYNYHATGIQLTNIGNDEIQWETTRKLNIGLQSYLFKNRLGINFDFYLHNTDNLLTLKTFDNPIGGINSYWSNGGSLRNTGFELNVNGKPIVTKNWRVEVGATMGHYVNRVTKLPNGDYTTSVYATDNVLTSVGNPVAVFYGYETAGVFATDAEAVAAGNGTYLYMSDNTGAKNYFRAGDVHFVDQNSDGEINASDKVIIGDPNPDIYGNIFATIGYKRLKLDLGFLYSLGNDVYNYQRSVLNAGSNFYNQQVAETAHWRYEGQRTDLPRLAYGDPMGNNRFSDRWIEDGSYLRLKTARLTYSIPVPGSWSWLQGLTVWAEARNVFTLTKYLGSDPEFSVANGVLFQGIDAGHLAQGRAFTCGLKINL